MNNCKAARKCIVMRLCAVFMSVLVLIPACGCGIIEDILLPAATAENAGGTTDGDPETPYGAASPSPLPELTEAEKQFWKQAEKLLDYYEDVALGSEYGDADGKVHKWKETVKLYVHASPEYEKYKDFYTRFIDRMNAIEGFPGIEFTDDPENASLTLEFVSAEELQNEIGAGKDQAYGFARISWYNSSGEIFKGNIYIVREEDSSEADVKHTLVEETAQAAGLMNDSYRYETSIFYQGYSTVNKLSEEDEILLRMHYSEYLSGGIDAAQVREIVTKLANS
ncbi:MAG: DUF2927 domain-containing protein [Clostridia bacterium]|nr:DUF2927 domain-containing protein [Clostridia bacterium]